MHVLRLFFTKENFNSACRITINVSSLGMNSRINSRTWQFPLPGKLVHTKLKSRIFQTNLLITRWKPHRPGGRRFQRVWSAGGGTGAPCSCAPAPATSPSTPTVWRSCVGEWTCAPRASHPSGRTPPASTTSAGRSKERDFFLESRERALVVFTLCLWCV